jgi:phosphoglycolate phosphatase-like HAD superfamily hydrolase
MDALGLVDAVIFDCDAVLVDSRTSYDRAIETTTEYFLSKIFGLRLDPNFPVEQLVEVLRGTGQYNNDIDATAAILVSITASLPSDRVMKRLETRDESVETLQEALESEPFVGEVLRLLEMASAGCSAFVDAVKAAVPNAAPCVDELLKRLGYPGGPASSLLSRVFDEYYYGPVLLKKLHGLDPVVGSKTGLIDSEKVTVSKETLRSLSSMLSKGGMGILSGRSRLGTEYTLGELIKFFQDGPMVFLEDHDPNLDVTQPIPGKPSPESLLLAAEQARTFKTILYVGDSAEDLMMTNNARRVRPNFAFCGVTGVAYSQRRVSVLAELGADAILESVNDLPALLSSLR